MKLASVHDGLFGTIENGIPPESERPTVAFHSIETDLPAIHVLRLNAPGYWNTHTRALDAVDAFDKQEFDGPFKHINVDELLEADPDRILGTLDGHGLRTADQKLRDDPVASEVTAVKFEYDITEM